MQAVQTKQTRIRIAARKELLEQNRLRNGFERRLVRQLQSGFKATGRLARKEYEQLGRLVETSRQSERKLRNVLESHYRAVIDAFGTRVLRNRVKSRELPNKNKDLQHKQDSQFEILIREYMNTVGGTRITQINNTTMKAINKVISKGAVEGLGVQAIGKNIFDKMDGSFSKLRSQTISRTETHSAASYANDRVNASLGIPNQIKRWVSVADARTRSWHVALNGTEVGKDEPFTVTVKGISYKMDYTGDPKGGAVNTINCRCVTLYLDPDDVIVDQPETIVEKPVKPVEPPKAPNVSIGFLLKTGSEKTREAYDFDFNSQLTDQQKRIVAKYNKPSEIRNSKDGYYQSSTKLLVAELNAKDGFVKGKEVKSFVIAHEYGHHIDYETSGRNLAWSETNDDFRNAIDKDLKSFKGKTLRGKYTIDKKELDTLFDKLAFEKEIVLRSKTDPNRIYGKHKEIVLRGDGYGEVSDIVDALARGRFRKNYRMWGHKLKYWKRFGAVEKEIFANLFSLRHNPKAYALAKTIVPNTVKEFEKRLDELERD